MKIAVPAKADLSLDEHFGHCAFYQVFTINEANEISLVERLDSPQGCGCKSNIAVTLAEKGVTLMLAGGIGAGAINVLAKHHIQVIRNGAGNARDLVLEYLSGKLTDGGKNCSSHEEGHECNH
jgi:predicted Fe-Mo cluster-binding NifX family protein